MRDFHCPHGVGCPCGLNGDVVAQLNDSILAIPFGPAVRSCALSGGTEPQFTQLKLSAIDFFKEQAISGEMFSRSAAIGRAGIVLLRHSEYLNA
jgi:hypothetical protein